MKSLIEQIGESLGNSGINAGLRHSLDDELSNKIDEIKEELLVEIRKTRHDIIFNWRIVQILMAISILGAFLI